MSETIKGRAVAIFVSKLIMPQFLILAEDYKDNEALGRRVAARPAHLQRMALEKECSVFYVGGAKLSVDGAMYGSMLVIDLETEVAVEAWIKQDPYFITNVWETWTITPFRLADV